MASDDSESSCCSIVKFPSPLLTFHLLDRDMAAAPNGITNVTRILEKAGHFTIFIRLLRSTQEENHLFSALNDSSSGLTIFAPTDSAFSELKSGTLNTLSDGDKSELVKFHVVPTFLSTSQFQTVSNPLGTWAGTGSRLPLNVTSYPNSVNITTGLTNTSLSGTVYTDNQLAIYKIEKVLLPKDVFGSKAPAPAPAAPLAWLLLQCLLCNVERDRGVSANKGEHGANYLETFQEVAGQW
ncbi:hypothetical protein OIU78_026776 [Salix suchowensis]|nr:hypothetical protein OIU78_026776 [Salix suchowensis]